MITEKGSEVHTASPTLKEVLKKIDDRNENAAVDIYLRILIGTVGLIVAILVFIFANPNEKMLGIAFSIFPVLPVFWGVSDDFAEAKVALREQSKEE